MYLCSGRINKIEIFFLNFKTIFFLQNSEHFFSKIDGQRRALQLVLNNLEMQERSLQLKETMNASNKIEVIPNSRL